MTVPVFVLGGAGTFGRHIVEGLLESSTAFTITVGGRDPSRFEKVFPKSLAGLSFQRVDIHNPSSLESALKDQKILILAAGPFQEFSTQIVLTASRLGIHYVDICDDPSYFLKLHAVRDKLNNSIFLTGLSSLPEVSLRLADSVRSRFDQIEDISIGLFIGNKNRKGLGAVMSAINGLGTETTIIENGVKKKIETWSLKEDFAYPEPIGKVPSYSFNSADFLVFSQAMKFNNLQVRVGFELALVRSAFLLFKQLARCGGLEPVKNILRSLPSLFNVLNCLGSDRGCVSVLLKGIKNNSPRWVRASLIAKEKGQRLAALPAVLGAETLAQGACKSSGLLAPMSWLSTDAFFSRLSLSGMEYRVEDLT